MCQLPKYAKMLSEHQNKNYFILFSHPINNAVFPPQIIRCILGIIKAGNRNGSYS